MNDLLERFFGRPAADGPSRPRANPLMVHPPSFQLLFEQSPLVIDGLQVQQRLREYHPELREATAEFMQLEPTPAMQSTDTPAAVIGLVAWGQHVIKCIGFHTPMPASVVERCVVAAHYDEQLKERAWQHAAHVLLYYAGYETDPLEQYVALAAAAAALVPCGAVIAAHEDARTSVPAAVFLPAPEDNGDTLQALRTLPLPFFYAGFVKMEVAGEEGVWMRTYNCPAFGLPDLAIRTPGHHRGTATFTLFSNILDYLLREKQTFSEGDTIGTSEGDYFRLRSRQSGEWFLDGNEPLFVLEPIAAEDLPPPHGLSNRP